MHSNGYRIEIRGFVFFQVKYTKEKLPITVPVTGGEQATVGNYSETASQTTFYSLKAGAMMGWDNGKKNGDLLVCRVPQKKNSMAFISLITPHKY